MEQSGTHGTDFDAPQLRAIEALVAGATVTAAAQAAGVGRTTMHRWLNDPAFVALLNQTKRDHLATIHAGLRTLAADAVAVLDEVLKTRKDRLELRVNIALKILKAVGADGPEPIGPVSTVESA